MKRIVWLIPITLIIFAVTLHRIAACDKAPGCSGSVCIDDCGPYMNDPAYILTPGSLWTNTFNVCVDNDGDHIYHCATITAITYDVLRAFDHVKITQCQKVTGGCRNNQPLNPPVQCTPSQ